MNQTHLWSKSFTQNDKLSTTGLILILLLLGFSGFEIEVVTLTSLQQNDTYKQLTGSLMLGLIFYQWYFALVRQFEPASASYRLKFHKMVGLLMPVLLFIHSSKTGHAYQAFIWFIFVIHCSVGFLNPEFMNIKKPALRLYWFITHIGLSFLVSGLIFFHLYVVYYYN